jgi:hypothetical protein
MNLFDYLKSQRRASLSLVIVTAALYAGSLTLVAAQDTNAPVAQASEVKSSQPAKTPEKKKLTGSELYQLNCNRCHTERYATEFTSAQWKTIMIHMRVRANLPAAQAREILKYLQEDSGN